MYIQDFFLLKHKFFELVEKYEKICLFTHQNPDGDGLAACLALKKLLEHEGKTVFIVLEEAPPVVFSYLDAAEHCVLLADFCTDYDLAILLDCHEPLRIGKVNTLLAQAKEAIAIDHHEFKAEFKALIYIDTNAVCAGEILHALYRERINTYPETLLTYYASCIYTTLLNDTDNFVNANTNANAFILAGELVKLGLCPAITAKQFLFGKPAAYMKFVGEALATIEEHFSGKVVFMTSTLRMLVENELTEEATMKLTRFVKGLKDVEVVVYFQEQAPDDYRLSFRSERIDVASLAQKYGGGGHKLASGCRLTLSLSESKELIKRELSLRL